MNTKKIDATHNLITLVWGTNSTQEKQTQILLRLIHVLTENSLSLLESDLETRTGWYRLELISELTKDGELDFDPLDQKLKKVAAEFGFQVENNTISPKNVQELEGNIIIVAFGEDRVGVLEKILDVVEQHKANVVRIESSRSETEGQFALMLHTHIPTTKDKPFKAIEQIRYGLQRIEREMGNPQIYTMVHRGKTLRYLQQIDYER